jgi:hypothetical protein
LTSDEALPVRAERRAHPRSAALTVDRFLNGLVGLRALQDYAVQCDTDNNTPERIDRNELWVDIAIKPTKSVEFIYVPIRITNQSVNSNGWQSWKSKRVVGPLSCHPNIFRYVRRAIALRNSSMPCSSVSKTSMPCRSHIISTLPLRQNSF